MANHWLACATQLEAEVSPQLYKTWIKPLTYLGYDESEHVLRIGAPNQFKPSSTETARPLSRTFRNCLRSAAFAVTVFAVNF